MVPIPTDQLVNISDRLFSLAGKIICSHQLAHGNKSSMQAALPPTEQRKMNRHAQASSFMR